MLLGRGLRLIAQFQHTPRGRGGDGARGREQMAHRQRLAGVVHKPKQEVVVVVRTWEVVEEGCV